MRVVVEVFGCEQENTIRLVPRIGPIREQTRPSVPAPKYLGRYLGPLMAAFQLADTQHVAVGISPVDAKGNPASLSGTPVWSVDNPNVIALTPTADGLSCDVAAVGPLSPSTFVSVKVTNADGTVLSGSLEVAVVGGAATTLTLTPGVPADIAPAPTT